ncbi:hypothetical protein EJ03DRAFT_342756 [Teratosphaeria nubilosa]|uniref:Protein kinase domain-containing protein n=1 Tax=Teratosphaeria nubilosa TaxID=161662 RepID=A0A6G1LD54_9PEZI|nr:hypothetical protein EJ03DRAFT_342756 [Teratosphaeria nubilosa]
MISTVTGDSGRVYTNGTLIRRHPQNRELDVYKAESAGQSFILKHVTEHLFRISQQIADDFKSTERLRVHTDVNKKDSILVYLYSRDTLLTLMRNDPDFPPQERLKIMRAVAVAVAELHAKGWIHADMLPEAQTGLTGRASDVYSLGLVLFLLDNYQDLLKAGITAEQEVLTRHFAYSGPVPENLYTSIPDEAWKTALRNAAQAADMEVAVRPGLRLRIWGQQMTEPTLDLLSGTNNLDPEARLTIRQVLEHPFWEDAASD